MTRRARDREEDQQRDTARAKPRQPGADPMSEVGHLAGNQAASALTSGKFSGGPAASPVVQRALAVQRRAGHGHHRTHGTGDETHGPGSAGKSSMPTLHPGDRSEYVMYLKSELKRELGINFQPPMGVYDPDTVTVVKRWQALQGIHATGVVDQETWATLMPGR
jgi:Putative peptidoglycan binding domain